MIMGSQRRKSAWEEGPGAVGQTGVSANTSFILGAGAQAQVDGLTLVRLRGELLFYLSAAGTTLDGFSGAFGIGVVTNAAFAVGASAVPMPITEMEENIWLYHQVVQCFGTGDYSSALRVQVDSKAMRKLNVGDTIYAALELTEVGTAVLQASFDSRVLVKLS